VTQDSPPGAPVPVFPYQLADVYLHSAEVARRTSTEVDQEQPTFATSLETSERDDGIQGFLASLSVRVEFKFRPEAVCAVSVLTTGLFVQVATLGADDDQRFRREDCAVLLWPYARANVAELVRMTGLTLPPLPTIDVRTVLGVPGTPSPSDRPDETGQ
jgi:preprotein translocase subunit SecB